MSEGNILVDKLDREPGPEVGGVGGEIGAGWGRRQTASVCEEEYRFLYCVCWATLSTDDIDNSLCSIEEATHHHTSPGFSVALPRLSPPPPPLSLSLSRPGQEAID